MEPFIGLYVILFLLMLVPQNSYRRTKTIAVLAGLSAFLLLALRDIHIGGDLEFYVPYFKNWARGIEPYQEFEVGYEYTNWFIGQYITTDPNMFLAIMAMIGIGAVGYMIWKLSPDQALSWIIFVSFVTYHFMFSGMRQAVAIGLIAVAYVYLLKKKLLWFLIWAFAAYLFHKSSIIFIVAYPLCNYINWTIRKYIITGLVMTIVIMLMKPILETLLPLIFEEGQYIGYIEKETTPAFNLFILLVLFFLFTFLASKPSRLLQQIRILIFFAVICQSLGFISEVATRIGYYFYLALIPGLPLTIKNMNLPSGNKDLVRWGIATFMCFFFFYNNAGGYLAVIPYKFFWE